MRNNAMEQMYIQMMYSGGGTFGGSSLLTVTIIAALFLILVFKPERIQSAMLFRWACTLVGLSILLPSLVSVFFSVAVMGTTGQSAPGGLGGVMMLLSQLSGPVMLGLSVLAAFAALRPRPARAPIQPPVPQKHPLD
jgi:hypothetical protein